MDDNYENHRRRQGHAARDESTEARDIGPIPAIKNPKRRAGCERDLRKFLLTYFADSFPLPFSEDHERILKEIEDRAIDGGLKAIAMPRGSGKTTILLRALIWVLAYGHRRFAVLVEADEGAAEESMDTIKIEWETNPLLLEDFPEIAYPIHRLQGITQRGNAQTSQGERTLIGWKNNELIFPTIAALRTNRKKTSPHPASAKKAGGDTRTLTPTSGATVRCKGILGRIRGMQKTTADGKTLRPDFVLVNDPQTDTSALSDPECAKREKILSGAIIGLAGPGKRIAGFAAVTVIREGDASDRLLNRKLMPKWHGDKCKLVYEWPTEEEQWKKYFEIRSEEIAAGQDEHPKANKYYRDHRATMDVNAKVGWEHRKFAHELSAIQHAMNLRHDNPDTFDAEYQNTPKVTQIDTGGLKCLSSDEFCLRVLPTHRRNEVPQWVEHITLGIDVQSTSLWWTISGISEDFTATILDYGVWPEPGIDYIALADIERTIAKATAIKQPAEATIEGLRRLTSELFSRRFVRDDSTEMRITSGIVDSGYQTESIYKFCRETSWPIVPSHGKGVTAKQRPWAIERRKRGERMGFGWRMPPVQGTRATRFVLIDTNTWKTQLSECFATPIGEPGAWTLFRSAPQRHRMIADNLAAEYPVQTTGQGRTLYEWTCRPNRDNHLLDATLLSAVAGAIAGAKVPGVLSTLRKPMRKVVIPGNRSNGSPDASGENAGKSSTATANALQRTNAEPGAKPKLSLKELRALKRR